MLGGALGIPPSTQRWMSKAVGLVFRVGKARPVQGGHLIE
jgi:hypothetical protein